MSDEIKRLIDRAPFSFVGTIVSLGAATMTGLSVDPRTAVIHVDHVLHAPSTFTNLEGQRITIQLAADQDPPPVGHSAAFFAEGIAFGESIAVREVGRLSVDAVAPHATAAAQIGITASAFAPLQRELRREKLRQHMTTADAVIEGRVVAVEKAGPATLAEHDPDWWVATIDAHHVERGNFTPGRVKVLFANSRDVRWHHAPKAIPGQGGVWILHRTEAPLSEYAPFVITNADDYQPTQELDTLRR